MKKKLLSICLSFLAFNTLAQNSSFDQKAQAYITQYAAWAIEEQQRVGIPASITLAQGIYETGAGESELATQANNHFGIKCKKEWRGETFAHTDDAPNECFRKYKSAKESYKDHSDYLKNSVRYAELFTFDVSNYIAWAKGLKKCGYATNPAYAQKLIKMVEDYDLQQYTLAASGQRRNEIIPTTERQVDAVQTEKVVNTNNAPKTSITEAADRAEATVMGSNDNGIVLINNIKAIYCKKGEMLLDKAMKYNVRYARLLEINELNDEPLPRDMHIYLEAKNSKGSQPTHIVKEGETIAQIAHNVGMSSRQLRIFNLMAQNEEAVAGSVLKLQEQSDERPNTYKMQRVMAPISDMNYKLKEPNKMEAKDEYVPTKKIVQATEEMEIGYGAERPSFLKKDSTQTIIQEIKQTSTLEKTKAEEKKLPNTEPMDEIALLKARLDKAVYSKSSKSNVKVVSSDSSLVALPGTAQKRTFEEPAKSLQSSTEPVFHVVEKGDTGFSIAKKYGIKIKQLNEWNNLNFDGIKIGQKLRVR